MIKCENGRVSVQGDTMKVLTEYTMITHTLRMELGEDIDRNLAATLLKTAYDMAFNDEMHKFVKE